MSKGNIFSNKSLGVSLQDSKVENISIHPNVLYAAEDENILENDYNKTGLNSKQSNEDILAEKEIQLCENGSLLNSEQSNNTIEHSMLSRDDCNSVASEEKSNLGKTRPKKGISEDVNVYNESSIGITSVLLDKVTAEYNQHPLTSQVDTNDSEISRGPINNLNVKTVNTLKCSGIK